MSRFTMKEKLDAVMRRIENGESEVQIAESIGVNPSTVSRWCMNYESIGPDAFIKSGNKKYSLELKETAVKYHLTGRGSLRETCKKFRIQSESLLIAWIKMYNSHNLKASPGGKVKVTMTKGRKTTLQERIDIVTDHIESGRSYAETAEKYQVSYQQIYQWVQKYNEQGIDGLVDRRGRTKPEEEMSEVEKLQAENRMLKAKLKRKELENLFLKKLDEIESLLIKSQE